MKRMRATEELQAQERELRNKDRKILAQFKNEAGDRTGLSPSARPPARPPRPTPPLCLSLAYGRTAHLLSHPGLRRHCTG